MRRIRTVGQRSLNIAIVVFAIVLAAVLGGAGARLGGLLGGILGALAGLIPPAVLTAAIDRRRRKSIQFQRHQASLELLGVPRPRAVPAYQSITAVGITVLLRPEEEVIPFMARPELDTLIAWCQAEAHRGVRLVTGQGGAGKTRLAVQLTRELDNRGWRTLWVRRGNEENAADILQEIGERTVLVIDYAETRGGLTSLLAAIADYDGPALRVILLARSSGEWWQQLAATVDYPARELLTEWSPINLGPLTTDRSGQRQVFDEAAAEFASRLGITYSRSSAPTVDPNAVVLVQHAAALLAVLEGVERGDASPPEPTIADVIAGLLRHEAGYWQRSAKSRGLNLDSVILRRAIAVTCLAGADDEGDAITLLTCIEDLAHTTEIRGQLARWLHDLYPAESFSKPELDKAAYPEGREWIGSLSPDLIAEYLIVSELAARPALVTGLATLLAGRRISRVLTILARAAYHQPLAEDLMRVAINADRERVVIPALQVAIETNPLVADLILEAVADHQISPETLRKLETANPYPSVVLASTAVDVLEQLLELPGTQSDERAAWLTSLGKRLADLGHWEKALAASESAVLNYRQLIQGGRLEFRPQLADALNSQSNRLAELGRWQDSLTAIMEAVASYRLLAQDHPDEFLPYLAKVLANLSGCHTDQGHWQEALTAADEAVMINRALVESNSAAFLDYLADSLNNKSNCLADLGRREEALAAINEAVTYYRQLALERPDAFLPDVAISLNNRAKRLADLKRNDEALIAIDEAVRIRRQLVSANPKAYLRYLARSLNNRARCLVALERREEALAAADEGVAALRQLTRDNPGTVIPDLAESLSTQSNCLEHLGRSSEALATAEEAVALHMRLAEDQPDAYLGYLAQSLASQSDCLASLGRREEALAAIYEAVDIRRQIARIRPAFMLPDLANALYSLKLRLTEAGREKESDQIQAELDATCVQMSARGLPDWP